MKRAHMLLYRQGNAWLAIRDDSTIAVEYDPGAPIARGDLYRTMRGILWSRGIETREIRFRVVERSCLDAQTIRQLGYGRGWARVEGPAPAKGRCLQRNPDRGAVRGTARVNGVPALANGDEPKAPTRKRKHTSEYQPAAVQRRGAPMAPVESMPYFPTQTKVKARYFSAQDVD